MLNSHNGRQKTSWNQLPRHKAEIIVKVRIINSTGKYFDNVSDNSFAFSGLNSSSSTILNIKIQSVQLNKAPMKFTNANIVSILFFLNNKYCFKKIFNIAKIP